MRRRDRKYLGFEAYFEIQVYFFARFQQIDKLPGPVCRAWANGLHAMWHRHAATFNKPRPTSQKHAIGVRRVRVIRR